MKLKKFAISCMLLAGAGGYAQAAPADGVYYLYDVTGQTFLSRGSSWATRAVTDNSGIPCTWNDAEGTITFTDNALRLFVADGTNLYTDNTTNSTGWQFVDAGDGTYYLQYGTEEKYIGHTNQDLVLVSTTAEAIHWQWKTVEERAAIIVEKTKGNYAKIIEAAGLPSTVTADNFIETLGNTSEFAAKDMTSSIGTAKFAGSIGLWTWSEITAQAGQPAYGTDYCEIWQATGSFTQTISVPQGIYKVTMDGFHRDGSYASCNTLGDAGYEPTVATLEANDAVVPLKSWYSGKTETNNPNNTGEAIAKFNAGIYHNELYTYVGEDGQLTLKVSIPSRVGDEWVIFNNFTLTYYTNEVSAEETEAIIATVPTGKMNAGVQTALTDARTAFETNKTISNYNALSSAIADANASIEAYAKVNAALANAATQKTNYASGNPAYSDAFDASIAEIQQAYDDGMFADSEADAKVAAVDGEINSLIKSQTVAGSDVTAGLPYADGSAATNWTIVASVASPTFHLNTWSTEADGSGMVKPFLEYWKDANGGAAIEDATITYAATGLVPNAIYKVSALVREYDETKVLGDITGAYLFAGSSSVDACSGTSSTYSDKPLKYGTYAVEGQADADGKLNFGIKVADAKFNWIAWKNVSVTYVGTAATAEQIAAMQAALATAEEKIAKVGFAAGEYAPYANAEAIAAVTEARALNTDAGVSGATIETLTTALSSWTANVADVNAVYDGTFKEQETWTETANVVLPGWNTVSGNTRHIYKDVAVKACLAGADDNSGLFVHPGTYQYGNTEGYTMPLKAATYYVAKAKYCSWETESNNGFSLTILKNGETIATKIFGANTANVNAADAFKAVEMLFKVEEAGNYVLSVYAGGNTFMTDFYVVPATAEEVIISEIEEYVPEERYANVTLTRTLVDGWNGLVLPFDMAVEDVKELFAATEVKEFSGITTTDAGTTLDFADATEVKAGVPVMIRLATRPAVNEYKVNGIYLPATALAPVTQQNTEGDVTYTFTGVYAPQTVYGPFTLVQGNYFYNYAEGKSAAASAFRAYFANESAATSGARSLVIGFGNLPTGVAPVAAEDNGAAGEGLKDLLGRDVRTAVKGNVYIKNGSKFIQK